MGVTDAQEGRHQLLRLLGGKSMKTKNIRSVTPRGFALAVFYANVGIENIRMAA